MRVRYASAPPTIVVPGGAVHSQRPCDQIACAPPARAMMRLRRDVGAARGGAAAAEVVAGLDVAAPARQVGGEVVGQRVLAGARVGRARQDEQDGCHEWQEADALHVGDGRPVHCHVSVPKCAGERAACAVG